MAYCQERITEFQMAWSYWYLVWICSGNEVKEGARQQQDPLPFLSRVDPGKPPCPPTDQKTAPTSMRDCGVSTVMLFTLPQVIRHLVTPYYGGLRKLPPVTWVCPPSDPGVRASVGMKSKTQVDKGCVFH